MAKEIERKFLVVGNHWCGFIQGTRCVQAYIKAGDGTTVRVRVVDQQAYLTVKSAPVSRTRLEFEYPIPVQDAEQMIHGLAEGGVIEKFRYEVPFGGTTWLVDEFMGANFGLVLAEVELQGENQALEMPPWIGAEVTQDPRYYNAALALRPYGSWSS